MDASDTVFAVAIMISWNVTSINALFSVSLVVDV
jgi:hypothetical protein